MIIEFRLNYLPPREQAKHWLSENLMEFPAMKEDIGPNIFHGWRFIRSVDGIVYFANCIDRGITEQEIMSLKNNGL